MKRLLLVLVLLSSCAVAVDLTSVNVALPRVSPEIALDSPELAELSITGTNETTEVMYVAVQYLDGTRWITLDEPIEIVLNDSIEVPLDLDPGTYTLRTGLWGFRPEVNQPPDKASIETKVSVIDNESQLSTILNLWQQRLLREATASKSLQTCLKSSEEGCVIQFIQDFQDYLWASHDVKDLGGVTRLTSNLQPQFSSFLYLHNIVLTKLEANFLAYCQEMPLDKASLATCSRKLQSKDIQTKLQSLKRALKVLNGLLVNNSYETFAYGETKGLFG